MQTKTKVGHQTKIIIPLILLLKLWKKDIECTKTLEPKQPYANLDKGGRETIKELSKMEDITITNADKEGDVIIVDTNDYIKEAERQLNDKDNYHILPQDPTLGNNKLVSPALDRIKKEQRKALVFSLCH